MENPKATYVDVLLPLALPGAFTYALPTQLAGLLRLGMRVSVPLGARKLYTGIACRLHNDAPTEAKSVKAILDIVDTQPILTAAQLRLWQWLADYYMCTMGEVMKAALPAGLKMESEMLVRRNPDFVGQLEGGGLAIYDLLSDDKAMTLEAIVESQTTSRTTVLQHLKGLMQVGAVVVEERLTRAYKPRTETHLRPGPSLLAAKSLAEVLQSLQRTPRQLDVMSLFLAELGLTETSPIALLASAPSVPKRQLAALAGFSDAALVALRAKGWIEAFAAERLRLKTSRALPEALRRTLSEEQQRAVGEIAEAWRTHRVCLLHGVTSSGKTEVYTELIHRELEAGRQVLYLVPEIALTTQLTARLGRVFGDKMGVYHSKFPDAERVELWQKQLSDAPFPLVVGVRSSVFLPFQNLGLVIVDEEHEQSYKQQDPAPRYNARDAAIVLAHQVGARVLLGTATPAIETYYNACEVHKYGYVQMTRRFAGVELPEIVVEDVKELHRKRLMPTPFSPRLTASVREALAEGGQAILFYNRRGYSPVLSCRTCGWTPHCSACDVPLTFHQRMNRLVCHYCGAIYDVPRQCPQCEDTELRDVGYGTEKMEAAVHACFADARTARMDLDTTRTRAAYERIINDFQHGQTNLLVGTQMVTKGLDFDGVRVVGILNADQALNVPDFRAYERAYQMLSQVAGRAGRRGRRGLVILQTRQAKLPLIQQVVAGDYEAMYRTQTAERRAFGYPPYTRLIYIYVKHRDEPTCISAAQYLGNLLRPHFERALLGPDRPAVGRIQRLFIRKLLLKVRPDLPAAGVRHTLAVAAEMTRTVQAFKAVQIYFDVDPLG